MEIKLAKTAGFCFGVARAIKTLEDKSKDVNISTLGPIIHNEFVVSDLETKGVNAIDSLNELEDGKILAIRTHGVGKEIIDEIGDSKTEYIDLTCPFVKKIHNIVHKHYNEGYRIVIVGNKNHPEAVSYTHLRAHET